MLLLPSLSDVLCEIVGQALHVFSSSGKVSCVNVDENPPYCLLNSMQLGQFLWSMEVSTIWRAVKYYVERRFRLDCRFLLELSPIDNVHC